jgi:hypothetical protein
MATLEFLAALDKPEGPIVYSERTQRYLKLSDLFLLSWNPIRLHWEVILNFQEDMRPEIRKGHKVEMELQVDNAETAR